MCVLLRYLHNQHTILSVQLHSSMRKVGMRSVCNVYNDELIPLIPKTANKEHACTAHDTYSVCTL